MCAGERLFASRSVDAVSIDDVVASASVAKGSFYNHFPDKEALAHTIAEEVRRELEARVEACNAEVDDPARRVARGIAMYLRFTCEETRRARILLRLFPNETSAAEPINRGLSADIRAGVRENRFEVESVEAAVIYVVGIGTAAQANILDDPTSAQIAPRSEQILVHTLRGLGIRAREAVRIARDTIGEVFSGHADPAPKVGAAGRRRAPPRF